MRISTDERNEKRMLDLRKTELCNALVAHNARAVCFGQIASISGKKQSFYNVKTERVHS